MSTHVDVLVVGLGPAGATAAAEAARRGHRVLAVDRKRVAGQPMQCAEFVPAILGTEVPAIARTVRQPIDSMRTFVEDDPPDVEPNFPGHMLDRAAFDAALVDEADALGVQCRFGAGARISMEHAMLVAELPDGEIVTADVVIGADGPRSVVGRALSAVNTELVETRQVTVRLLRPQRSTDVFLSGSIPGGYAWLFPKDGVANVGVGVAQARRDELKPILAALVDRLARAGAIEPEVLALTGGAIPVGGMLSPAHALDRQLVLLAGDAAGLTNPITGAGIASAVISGRLAGRAAAARVEGDAHAAADYRDELQALFAASLGRALQHRRTLEAAWQGDGRPDKALLRRGWIAYPQYWAASAPA